MHREQYWWCFDCSIRPRAESTAEADSWSVHHHHHHHSPLSARAMHRVQYRLHRLTSVEKQLRVVYSRPDQHLRCRLPNAVSQSVRAIQCVNSFVFDVLRTKRAAQRDSNSAVKYRASSHRPDCHHPATEPVRQRSQCQFQPLPDVPCVSLVTLARAD